MAVQCLKLLYMLLLLYWMQLCQLTSKVQIKATSIS